MKEKYAVFRLINGRGNAHLSVLSSIYTNIGVTALLIKSLGWPTWTVPLFGVTLILTVFTIGYLDVRSRFFETENTVNNEHNKELMMAANK